MKYKIYHGSTPIIPADNVAQIYHGATLIWERSVGFTISEAFAAAAIHGTGYVFTKGGLLIPRSFTQDAETLTVYDLTGAAKFVDVSTYHASGKAESWQYVYADTPTYYDERLRDLLIFSTDLSTASRISWGYSSYTASKAQALAAFTKYGSAKASVASGYYSGYTIYPGTDRQAYGGVVPFARFVAVDKAAEDVVFLSCIKDGELQTITPGQDGGYIVLDATASGLICAESPTLDISLQVNARISLRDFSGDFVKYLTDAAICLYDGTKAAAYQYPARCFQVAGDALYYIPGKSAPYEWEKAGGVVWCAHPGTVPSSGGATVTADGDEEELKAGDKSYSQGYVSAAGGYHYCDGSGNLYIMATDDAGRTDDDGDSVGIVLKISKS